MSWENILKRDPLKSNAQELLDFAMDMHLFISNQHRVFIKHLKQKTWPTGERELTRNMSQVEAVMKLSLEFIKRVEDAIKEINEDANYGAQFLLATLKPAKNLFENVHRGFSGLPKFFLEEVGMPLPKLLNFDKMIREVEMFVGDDNDN
tara:strand:+ start:3027 stop:3473 length:447 start_codon:yes stop_codon:yes gene_type:complete